MIDLGEIEFGIMSKLIRQQITHHFAPNRKSIRHKRKSFCSRNKQRNDRKHSRPPELITSKWMPNESV